MKKKSLWYSFICIMLFASANAQDMIVGDPAEPCGPPRKDYWIGRHDHPSPQRGGVGACTERCPEPVERQSRSEGSKPRQATSQLNTALIDSYTFYSNVRVNDNPPGTSFESPYSSGSHAIAARGDTVYLVWRSDRNTNSTIYFDKSTDGGNTWATDVRITDSDSAAIMPALALGQDGTIYVSWTDFRDYYTTDRHIYFAKSIDGGTSFLPSVRVCNDHEAYQAFSSIAVNDSGLIFVSWEDGRDAATQKADVYCARSENGGATFLASVRVDDTGTDSMGQGNPCIAVNDTNVYIVWQDSRNYVNGGPRKTKKDIYSSVSHNNGVSFGGNVRVNDRAITDSMDRAYPSMVLSHDTIQVVFEDWQNNNGDIYSTKSTDSGFTFTSPNINLIDAAGSTYYQGYPSLACDDSGGVYCAWEDRRNGLAYPWLIYFNYSKNYGDTFATNNTHVDDCGFSDNVYLGAPTVAANRKGKVFSAWEDNRNNPGGSNCDIYTTAGNYTGIEGEPPQSIVAKTSNIKCYPNPCQQTTVINYQLAKPGQVSLKVYNTLGQSVKTLVNETQQPGYYSVAWDGKDGQGQRVSAGVYFFRLNASSFNGTKKIVVLK